VTAVTVAPKPFVLQPIGARDDAAAPAPPLPTLAVEGPSLGGRVVYPGPVKVEVCRRLGRDWVDLADYVMVPAADRSAFAQGREASGIWEWLHERLRLGELSPALRALGRADLADLLDAAAGR
jgi:hypothetical protein